MILMWKVADRSKRWGKLGGVDVGKRSGSDAAAIAESMAAMSAERAKDTEVILNLIGRLPETRGETTDAGAGCV